MIKVNAIKWVFDLEHDIEVWNDYGNSVMCETYEDRQNAVATARRLEDMLDQIMYTGEVSEKDFEWYIALL